MKWVKSVVLTAAMAVVAYGVWSTLTRGPKKDQDNAALSSAPPFKAQKSDEESQQKERVVAAEQSEEKAPPSLDEHPPTADIPAPPDGDPSAPDAASASGAPPATPGDSTGSRYETQDPGVSTGISSGVAVVSDHAPADPFSTVIPAAPAVTQPAPLDADYALAMQQIEVLLAQGRLGEAHLELSKWYSRREGLNLGVRQEMIDLLDRLTGTVVYSREHLLQPAHTVMEGETPEQIAAKYHVPWELLAKINGKQDPTTVRPGDQLKVMTGPFNAEVDTQSFELVVFLPDGRYAGRFMIGVGKELPTQPGDYQVTMKMENPPYAKIAGGDPTNPLGRLLLQVGDSMGIHGTNDPSSLGKPCEKGCISLSDKDIDDVYDILAQGSTVKVVR